MQLLQLDNLQTTVYVDSNAVGANDGTTPRDAFTDLQPALAFANENECIEEVLVAEGRYLVGTPRDPATTSFRVRGGLALKGGYPSVRTGGMGRDPEVYRTTLDGNGSFYHVVVVTGTIGEPAAVLDGLIITGGNAGSTGAAGEGGGLLVSRSNAVVNDCELRDNRAAVRGGAVSVINIGTLEMTACELDGNSAPLGGAVYFAGASCALSACSLARNDALSGRGGGGLYVQSSQAPELRDCFLLENRAAGGGGIFVAQGGTTLINCTLRGNQATGSGGGLYVDAAAAGTTLVSNSIIWQNTDASKSGAAAQILSLGPAPEVSYSAIQDADPGDGDIFPGTGNLDGDHLFLAPGDARLERHSPCIDAGDSGQVAGFLPVDLLLAPRRVDDRFTPDTGPGGAPVVDMGAVEFARILYVNAGNSSRVRTDGRSWGTAYRELWSAIEDAARAGSQVEEIWVQEGVYRPGPVTFVDEEIDPTASFRLRSGLALYGGFDGGERVREDRDPKANPTILSGDLLGNDDLPPPRGGTLDPEADNCFHVVTAAGTDESAVLDGFTIRRGSARYSNGEGGGLLADGGSPVVADCRFTLNTASLRGGAVSVINGGSPLFRSCRFERNAAARGGAVYCAGSSPKLRGCFLRANRATSSVGGALDIVTGSGVPQSQVEVFNCAFAGNCSAGTGGGIFVIESRLSVINSSFHRNEAVQSGGGIRIANGSVTVENSILWGNMDGGGDLAAAQVSGPATKIYCLIQGGTVGGGNIDANPRFASGITGDLRLTAGSPAIDAGRNDFVPGGIAADLLGNRRFLDDPFTADTGEGAPPVVDLGAYEYDLQTAAAGGGDADNNGRVDGEDFARFFQAMTGPDRLAGAADRLTFDADRNGTIDMVDFIAYQRAAHPPPAGTAFPALNVRVLSASQDHVTARAGEVLPYEVNGVLAETSNFGIATVVFDLALEGGELVPAVAPSPMESFVPLAGMTNPFGYGGTVLGEIAGVILQVGGAQNTIANTADPRRGSPPYPRGEVVTRIAHDEVLLATGTLRAPAEPGLHALALASLHGAVLVERVRDRQGNYAGWAVESIVPGSIGNLMIEVLPQVFRRGETNSDGRVDISDGVRTLSWLFLGADQPSCLDAADANDDGTVDLSDGVATFAHLFLGGRPIPAPGPLLCGEDPTADRLSCEAPPPCP